MKMKSVLLKTPLTMSRPPFNQQILLQSREQCCYTLHNIVWVRHLTTTLLNDKEFDLKQLKPILMKDLESPNFNIESCPPVRIPRKLKEAEELK